MLLLAIGAILLLHFYEAVDLGLFVANYHAVVIASFVIGMLASLAFYVKGLSLPTSVS